MAAAKPVAPKNPLPKCKTKDCKRLVSTPYSGSCDECHAKVFAEFSRVMGWT